VISLAGSMLARAALPPEAPALRSDFLDGSYWAELASVRGLRLPRWAQRYSRGQAAKWLRRVGISTKAYLEASGEASLSDFGCNNPDWPLRAWVGLLLEIAEDGRSGRPRD
jgi:hypothetical protein